MLELHETLKERGVLFCSNPRRNNQEGFSGERYGFYYNWNIGKNFFSILDLKRLNTFIDLMEFLKKKGHG